MMGIRSGAISLWS